jgi:hypothetical protein
MSAVTCFLEVFAISGEIGHDLAVIEIGGCDRVQRVIVVSIGHSLVWIPKKTGVQLEDTVATANNLSSAWA